MVQAADICQACNLCKLMFSLLKNIFYTHSVVSGAFHTNGLLVYGMEYNAPY
jgi:hypothetical protein